MYTYTHTQTPLHVRSDITSYMFFGVQGMSYINPLILSHEKHDFRGGWGGVFSKYFSIVS